MHKTIHNSQAQKRKNIPGTQDGLLPDLPGIIG